MWAAAVVITLLLTIGLASFLIPNARVNQDFYSLNVVPQAIRGLVGLVFLFDLYMIYQHLLIHRIRRELVKREELFHLISENAADMIAVVDMEGRRVYNSHEKRQPNIQVQCSHTRHSGGHYAGWFTVILCRDDSWRVSR